MKTKPRILIICPFFSPNLGGVETHLDMLTDYLVRKKYRTTVLTYKPLTTHVPTYVRHEERDSLEIYRFWWFGHGWFDKTTPYPILQFLYIVPGLLVRSLFYMAFHHREIDTIHAHGFAAAFVTRIVNLFFPVKRKVVSTHFIYKRLKQGSIFTGLFRWVIGDFERILLIGKESGRELQRIGLPKERMEVFHHWLDQELFAPQDKKKCRKELGLPLNPRLLVLFAGRLLQMKGVFELFKVARSVSDDIVFVLVGSGPDEELLRMKTKNMDNFIMVGRKSHQEIATYLGAADLLILPSLAEEAQPMVIMEALSCGRPVVVTNKGAAKEMFDSTIGLVVSPNQKTIKRALLSFIQQKDMLKIMSEKARLFAETYYSEKNARIITQSYIYDQR